MKKSKLLVSLMAMIMFLGSVFAVTGCKKEKNPPGEIYILEEAYENGWITREHLLSIAYYFGQKNNNEELLDENYAPIPKNPKKLSEKTALKIRKTKLYNVRKAVRESAVLSDITIKNYFGYYEGYYVITTSVSGIGHSTDIKERVIDGILFTYTYEFPVLWKEN